MHAIFDYGEILGFCCWSPPGEVFFYKMESNLDLLINIYSEPVLNSVQVQLAEKH